MPTSGRQAEEILINIGRLIESANSASDAIKTLNAESRETSLTARNAAAAVSAIQGHLTEIDKVVRTGNGESLVTQVRLICEEQKQVREDIEEQQKDHKLVVVRVEALEADRSHRTGRSQYAMWLLGGLGYLITNLVTYYAALAGK